MKELFLERITITYFLFFIGSFI